MNIIIDGNNLLHRSYWTAKYQKADSTNEDGLNPYSIFIFLRTLRSFVENNNPSDIYIAWDRKAIWPSTNFRKTAMEGTYKGTRVKTDNNLFKQEGIIYDIVSTLGVKNMHPYVLEADDVISWLTTKIKPNTIISVDHDLLQLISEDTSFFHLKKKQMITTSNFEEVMNVPLNAFLYYKAILGDSSDNIKGFPGFGKVRSRKLALDLAAHNGDITKINLAQEYIDIYEKNRKITDLKIGYTIEANELPHYEQQFAKLTDHKPDFSAFATYCEQLGFKTIAKDIEEWKAVFTLKPKDNLNAVNLLS